MLLPLTGIAAVVNGDATVVVSGIILNDLNCRPGTSIVLAGLAYFVLSRTDTTHLELTRTYAGTTSASVPCEISQITADGVSTAVANARLAEMLNGLSVVEANGRGLFYRFSTTTTDADPGSGAIRLNNANPALATAAYIDNSDANGALVSGLLDTWDDSGTSSGRGQLWLRGIADPSSFRAYLLTSTVLDGTGYRKLTLAHVSGSGGFVDGDELMVMFVPLGPQGTNGSNGISPFVAPQCRLSLTSGAPVQVANALAATTIYYVPCIGNQTPIWVTASSAFSMQSHAELSLALDSNSGHTGYHQSGKNMDLVVFLLSGVPTLGTGVAWASDTSLGTGAGTAEREFINGIWVNKNSMVLRHGSASGNTVTVAAREATIVGSVRFTANGQTEFTIAPTAALGGTNNKLALCNIYNQRPVIAVERDSTAGTWNVSTVVTQAANSSASNRISFLNALADAGVSAQFNSFVTIPASSAAYPGLGIGLDSTTVVAGVPAVRNMGAAATGTGSAMSASYDGTPGIGWHYVSALESNAVAATGTFQAGAFYRLAACLWM